MRSKAHQGRGRKKLALRLLAAAGVLAAVLAALYVGGRYLERSGTTEAYGSLEGRFEEDRITEYEGKQYRRNMGIRSYLFMGVDQRGTEPQMAAGADYRGGGQSDFLLLLMIDPQQKLLRRLQIDRDTMAEITVVGVLGNELGTNTHQICLSHGFGDGREQSCRYTVEAVQRLLCGIPIDGYFSLNLDGIGALNTLLGGVTVTLEDDFSHLDPAMIPGATLTLQGRQAEIYVRERMSVSDGTNAARMVRQQQFLNKAADLVAKRVGENANFVGTLFDGLKEYTLTDISRGKMINEANKAGKYTVEPTQTLAGEHTIGQDGFVEFHPDEAVLMQQVLDLFYTPVTE